MKRTAIILGLLSFIACGKKEIPPTQPAPREAVLKPWTCEILNGVLVVRGEVDRPMDLILEGRSIRETHHADFGPVRWELFKPPVGEVARLRAADGRVLAQWKFGVPSRGLPSRMAAAASLRQPKLPTTRSLPLSEDPMEVFRRADVNEGDRPVALRPLRPPRAPPRGCRAPPRPPTSLATAPSPAPVLASIPPLSVPILRAELAPRHLSNLKGWPQPQPQPLRIAPQPLPLTGDPWPGAGEALNLVRGPKALQAGQRRMVLSFDGGSSDESAEEILDALQSRSVHTTIFLTGTFIQKFPDLVRRMAREGHELGNHTMNHPHFAPGMKRDAMWTKGKFQEELLSADRALVQVLGRPMDPYWRAPYGEQTKELRAWAEEIGFRHVGWSEGADTLDWATPNEKRVYRPGDAVLVRLHARLARADSDGLIVLMHLGSGRPEADRPSKNLGAFMDRAAKEGWRFVRVSDYLHELRKPVWNPAARLALLEAHGGGTPARAALRK